MLLTTSFSHLTSIEEKDALTIYIRNVTEHVTYEMLHEAFSAFGTIRTLNVVHPKVGRTRQLPTENLVQ